LRPLGERPKIQGGRNENQDRPKRKPSPARQKPNPAQQKPNGPFFNNEEISIAYVCGKNSLSPRLFPRRPTVSQGAHFNPANGKSIAQISDFRKSIEHGSVWP
jgi:hypothetical protein